MPRSWIVTCAPILVIAASIPARAQSAPPLSPLEISVACAPAPRLAEGGGAALTIVGSEDSVPRTAFDTHDTVVIGGGSKSGLAIGQRYYVRHGATASAYSMTSNGSTSGPRAVQTIGWIRILAVNDTTSLATVEHACQPIGSGDYLEPYAPPTIPAALTQPGKLGDLDFSSPGRVLFGDEDRGSAGSGEFIVIDRGEKTGTSAGARLAIYRDLKTKDLPLTRIGEAVVVSVGPDVAVARIVHARDAVFAGDYLVPEKK